MIALNTTVNDNLGSILILLVDNEVLIRPEQEDITIEMETGGK